MQEHFNGLILHVVSENDILLFMKFYYDWNIRYWQLIIGKTLMSYYNVFCKYIMSIN